MNDDRGIAALPKLYGASAYARPPVAVVNPPQRPFDPDDMPLEFVRHDHGAEPVPELRGQPYGSATVPGSSEDGLSQGANLPSFAADGGVHLRPRLFRLRRRGSTLNGQEPASGPAAETNGSHPLGE